METITSEMDKMVNTNKNSIDHLDLCKKLAQLGKFADDIRERVELEKLRRNSHNSDR